MKIFNKKSKGFTLIELVVVIAIIGMLATIVLVSLSTAREKARDSKRLSDIRQVALALEMYYNDYGYYPGATALTCDNTTWTTMGTALVNGGYVKIAPVDPLNDATRKYMYGTSTATGAQIYTLKSVLERHNMAHNTDVDDTSNNCVCGADGTTEREYCLSP